MNEERFNEALKIVGDYADVIWQTGDMRDRDTMQVAFAMEDLYQQKDVWVAEWLDQSPKGPRASNRWQEDSRNRFAQWLSWRLQQEDRKPIDGSTVYRFKDAAEIAAEIPSFAIGDIKSEFQLRPLRWLKKYHYTDRTPDIVRRAVELGGGQITNKVMRQALNEWKLEYLGGNKIATKAGKKRRADAIEKARKARLDLERRFDDFLFDALHGDDGTRDELKALLTHIKTAMQEVKANG